MSFLAARQRQRSQAISQARLRSTEEANDYTAPPRPKSVVAQSKISARSAKGREVNWGNLGSLLSRSELGLSSRTNLMRQSGHLKQLFPLLLNPLLPLLPSSNKKPNTHQYQDQNYRSDSPINPAKGIPDNQNINKLG